MKQSKIANQILNMLDDKKRKSMLLKVLLLFIVSIIVYMLTNQRESPLSLLPRTFFGFLSGYLFLYFQSNCLYPQIRHYFDLDALRRDADSRPSPFANDSQDAQ